MQNFDDALRVPKDLSDLIFGSTGSRKKKKKSKITTKKIDKSPKKSPSSHLSKKK